MKFSQFYLPPQEYTFESKKMRTRLGSYIFDLSFKSKTISNHSLASNIVQKTGIEVPGRYAQNQYVYDFKKLFCEVTVVDLLDTLSVVYAAVGGLEKDPLIKFVNQCFNEEGVAYAMNEQGEVRFRPDQEFERNRILTLRSLTGDDFAPALEAFNRAYTEFQRDTKKSKSALRYIFEANEILFKKISKPKYDFDQLNSKNIEKTKEHIINDVALDATAKKATNKFLESYKNWVEAMHPYRHGQDTASYDNPSVDIAIFALSTGACYLRWLASMARAKIENKKSGTKP